MTQNQLRYHELQETRRSHKTDENERQRHNLAVETENQRSNIASELNVRHNTNVNYHLGYLNYLETGRSNRERESNTRFANQTQRLAQQETARANRANEAIRTTEATTGIVNSLENIRTHKANETIAMINSNRNYEYNMGSLAETKRSNLAKESLNQFATMETVKHNRITERETNRHNMTVETETKRHNLIGEMQKNVDLINNANSIKFNTLSNVLRSASSLITIK